MGPPPYLLVTPIILQGTKPIKLKRFDVAIKKCEYCTKFVVLDLSFAFYSPMIL
jgi:hypothetical protein